MGEIFVNRERQNSKNTLTEKIPKTFSKFIYNLLFSYIILYYIILL